MAIEFERDVIVIGGGIFGLSCAWSCVKRGLSVTLVEKSTIGSGASGGIMGTLSPNVPETWSPKKQFQLDALLSAEAHWNEIEAISTLPTGYGRVGRLIPIVDERALGHANIRQEDAKTLWQGQAEWRVTDGGEYADWIAPEAASMGVIHENLSARISPRLACKSLARALEIKGCKILEGWEVTDLAQNQISGPNGTLKAKTIILSAGVECFSMLADILGPKAGFGVKGQSALLTGLDMRTTPQIFAEGIYIIPHANGDIAIGSTTENDWENAYDTDEKLDEVLTKAFAIAPILKTAQIVERWAGLRPRCKKPDPMLGPVPGAPDLFLATGGYKIGFGIAHSAGEAIAEMVTGNAPYLPEKFFVRLK